MEKELLFSRINEESKQESFKFDVKDKRILSLISENCRIPLSQLRKTVSLSRDAVKYRIQRMQKKKLILGFVPQINIRNFGFYDFHVFIGIDERRLDKKYSFVEYLKQKPYVRKVIEYSDRYDFEIVILAHSLEEFDDRLTEIITSFPELIMEKETMHVIKGYLSAHIPKRIYNDANIRCSKRFRLLKEFKLDEIDMKLMDILFEDARTPFYNIAKKLNMTGEAISYRMKNLYKNGVIRKYTCIVNFNRLKYHWYTFLLRSKNFTKEHDRKLHKFAESNPFILKAVKCLGTWDFIFYIAADDHRHFHYTVNKIKIEFSDIIKDYETLLAYKEHFYKPFPEVIGKINK
ncbi:Lrp/AsnC family transcriptional regulator [Candidatus Woesearchaeota archaeon]|nr:Lrp/AsnC family transcriptional regulator [Candidatus Woesearchaeota archaeon]